MFSWVSTHFLNPSLFWPAVGLMAVPILIHLINRLRYKRVRFAAMEFLLQSQQRNRRRVLIEHLLLLAARVLAVGFIGLLIARFVADPKQISMFQGAKTHHVLLIDDSVPDQLNRSSLTSRSQVVGERELRRTSPPKQI